MKMDKVANSKNDEFYTPEYAIYPILKYLDKQKFKTIWCPFDTEDSLFVKIFRKGGFNVVATHIQNGQDFFKIPIGNLPLCDVIISNPPYSLKGEVLDRLFLIGKPFAMLVGVVGLFESKKRFEMFKENDFEVLYLNKRVAFFKDFSEQKPSLNPPFSSVYLCSQLLPKQICFEEVDKSQSPTSQTSPKGDFSKEKEHNISLKESSAEDSQMPNSTSLNNNIMPNSWGELQVLSNSNFKSCSTNRKK